MHQTIFGYSAIYNLSMDIELKSTVTNGNMNVRVNPESGVTFSNHTYNLCDRLLKIPDPNLKCPLKPNMYHLINRSIKLVELLPYSDYALTTINITDQHNQNIACIQFQIWWD